MSQPRRHGADEDRSLLWVALACALVAMACVALGVAGCGYAKHKDPPTYLESSAAAANEAARLHARDAHGLLLQVVNPEGSMQPLIFQGDWLVCVPTPLGDDLLGKVVSYRPAWNHGQNTTHRLAAKDRYGYIASGDHNAHSEPQERVTTTNYVGEIIAIYREAKP